MSSQDIISLYNINTISSRYVMRIMIIIIIITIIIITIIIITINKISDYKLI